MSSQRLSFALRPMSRPVDLLTVRLRDSGPITVIEVAGELDMATSDLLTQLADTVLHEQRPPVMVLDLANLRFLCADGIRALLHVRAAATHATHLVLRDPSPIVVKVLRITGMLDTFEIDSTAAADASGAGREVPGGG